MSVLTIEAIYLDSDLSERLGLRLTVGKSVACVFDDQLHMPGIRSGDFIADFGEDLKAVTLRLTPLKGAAEPISLSLIRKWPEGFDNRLQAVWLDVISFIPNVKLYDLQRVLAEFGFRMEVYESVQVKGADPVPPPKPVGRSNEGDLVPLDNGRSIDLGGRWKWPT